MNILFAFADDWGRYASAYSKIEGKNTVNSLIKTPNFDRIAREGVLFTNAYVPAPSCTPCRSSVLSGRYFWNTGLGAILGGAVWDESIESYPLELEKKGWFIGHTYKVWSPGKTKNAPYGAERTSYTGSGILFNNFSHNATKRAPDIGVDGAKQELYDEVRGNFKSFLQARPDDAPFCYWWGPTNTHRTWEQGSGKELWGLEPDDLKGRMPEFMPDADEVRQDFSDYLGECMAFDAGLGVLISELEEIGELDDTLIVVSGDHGIPGMPRAKCNLYDIGCEVAMAMRWPGKIKPGRVVSDFINIMDLAPTLMDAAGEDIPEIMDGKSLLPIMLSQDSGNIEEERNFVITGRERHTSRAREGMRPYPQRAIRTEDYIYIVNFEPDRWPMGDPKGLDDISAAPPAYELLQWKTHTVYSDFDASPTKAWMIYNRAEDEVKPLFELAFGKRAKEELYDLSRDPSYMNNIAEDKGYEGIKTALKMKLFQELKKYNDPRVVETPCRFETQPYAGELQDFQK
jgi:arylsulfatase A-like enzyme